MKKSSVFIQIVFASLWILGGIVLIVLWLLKIKGTIEINGGIVFTFAAVMIALGAIKILEVRKTQKRFQKLFQKNEEDKAEIEEMKKEILK